MKQSIEIPQNERLLSRNRYEAGDFVSADQFVVSKPGHLLSGFGWEVAHEKFYGDIVIQDAMTGITWVVCQISSGAGETIMAKV